MLSARNGTLCAFLIHRCLTTAEKVKKIPRSSQLTNAPYQECNHTNNTITTNSKTTVQQLAEYMSWHVRHILNASVSSNMKYTYCSFFCFQLSLQLKIAQANTCVNLKQKPNVLEISSIPLSINNGNWSSSSMSSHSQSIRTALFLVKEVCYITMHISVVYTFTSFLFLGALIILSPIAFYSEMNTCRKDHIKLANQLLGKYTCWKCTPHDSQQ
jgi:hypothetical protein